MTPVLRLRVPAYLLTCLMGQACSPVIYELTVGTDSAPQPGPLTDAPDPTDPTDPDPPPTCDDGLYNGSETDLDCGGPCGPCDPGPPRPPCNKPEDCQAPTCKTPKDCPALGECIDAICTLDGRCIGVPRDAVPCLHPDLCSMEAMCVTGECISLSRRDCSDLDGPCRAGVCNSQSGNCAVEWPLEGAPCQADGVCDMLAKCSEGECIGGPSPAPLLFTDFSLADGWIAHPPWSLGPATPSICSMNGQADDPDDDHSPGPDGNLAGAEIGGCLPLEPFPALCLESPPIDATAPGELRLTYWSVLRTAGAAMRSRVEVEDGKGPWLPVWVSEGDIDEPDWTEHSIDLTPFKNPALRLRFCHQSMGTTDPVGGWSIDDISVGPPPCK